MVVLNRSDVKGDMDTELLFQEEFLMAVPACHEINEKAEYVPGSRYRKLKPEYLNGETLILHGVAEQPRDRGCNLETIRSSTEKSPSDPQHGDGSPDGSGGTGDHVYPGSVCGKFSLSETGQLLYPGH